MNPVWHFVNGVPQVGTLRVTSSQITVGNGAALAPAYSFTSETTTGWFLAAAGTVDLSTTGTDRFRFSAYDMVLASAGTINWSSGAIGAANDITLSRQSAGTPVINGATATPAGGSTGLRLVFGSTAGFGVYIGSGAPTVSAAQGSIYLRSDGSSTSTRLYVNTNGTTGWTNVTTAA